MSNQKHWVSVDGVGTFHLVSATVGHDFYECVRPNNAGTLASFAVQPTGSAGHLQASKVQTVFRRVVLEHEHMLERIAPLVQTLLDDLGRPQPSDLPGHIQSMSLEQVIMGDDFVSITYAEHLLIGSSLVAEIDPNGEPFELWMGG